MKWNTFPLSLAFLVALIAIAHGLANVFYWYYTIWWFDIPMHFLGGFWVGAVALWALATAHPHASFRRRLASGLGAALVAGVLWEVMEFGLDTIGDSIDTRHDLMFDLLGALTAVFIRNNDTNNV